MNNMKTNYNISFLYRYHTSISVCMDRNRNKLIAVQVYLMQFSIHINAWKIAMYIYNFIQYMYKYIDMLCI